MEDSFYSTSLKRFTELLASDPQAAFVDLFSYLGPWIIAFIFFVASYKILMWLFGLSPVKFLKAYWLPCSVDGWKKVVPLLKARLLLGRVLATERKQCLRLVRGPDFDFDREEIKMLTRSLNDTQKIAKYRVRHQFYRCVLKEEQDIGKVVRKLTIFIGGVFMSFRHTLDYHLLCKNALLNNLSAPDFIENNSPEQEIKAAAEEDKTNTPDVSEDIFEERIHMPGLAIEFERDEHKAQSLDSEGEQASERQV